MGSPNAIEISCSGGLNLSATTAELFKAPGYARKLENFESSFKGGYRRINGYAKYGTTQPSGSNDTVLGVIDYANGVVACVGYNIYYSEDGITWIQMNKDLPAGGNAAALAGAAAFTRNPSSKCQFTLYEGNTDYGELIITNGKDPAFWIKMIGNPGSYTYYTDELDNATYGAPAAPKWCEVYKDHLILGRDNSNPETVYWSDTFDPTDFLGANAGSSKLADKISGVKVWRDRLFIFGDQTISELVGINSTAGINTVSRNIGCLDGHSIQEVGGDLLYLSVDGIRTLSGTEKIDDIKLSSISLNIDPLVLDVIRNLTNYNISSCVIRDKNQYRLYYTKPTVADGSQLGIIGTYSNTGEGLRWEWSTTRGIPVAAVSSTINQQQEKVYHGGYDGYIYQHDTGSTFDGAIIESYYETPEIVYNTLAQRKTLHWVHLSADLEGEVDNLKMKIRYDFGNAATTHQPDDFVFDFSGTLSYYGVGTYGLTIYSIGKEIEHRQLVNGAGFSNNFLFYNTSGGDPFTIQSIFIFYYEGGIR